jgi:hypothetical protein
VGGVPVTRARESCAGAHRLRTRGSWDCIWPRGKFLPFDGRAPGVVRISGDSRWCCVMVMSMHP